MITKPFRLSSASDLASLGGATAWLNSPPLTAADLRGKVVLVDFWTYTCINWLRTLPYVPAWAKRYKEQGLIVIGVHTRNSLWPALYFIDATGRVRDHHFGEGNYEESETRIRQLLTLRVFEGLGHFSILTKAVEVTSELVARAVFAR